MDSEKAAVIENSEEDVEEVEEEEEGSDPKQDKDNFAAVLKNPQVMAELQARLDAIVGDPSGYIKVLENAQFL